MDLSAPSSHSRYLSLCDRRTGDRLEPQRERTPFISVCIIGILLLAANAPANAQGADSKPKPTGSISGRVLVDGNAAPGVPVAVVAGETVNRREAAGKAVTDVEGHYRVPGLAAGPYQVWTLTPGMLAEPTQFPSYSSYPGAAKSIILGANEDVTEVDLVIPGCKSVANAKVRVTARAPRLTPAGDLSLRIWHPALMN